MVEIRKKLIENPIGGAILLILIFYGFFLISMLIYYYFSYYLELLFVDFSFNVLVSIRFLIIFALLGIFCIVIIPIGLHFPNGKLSINEYLKTIKLRKDEYILRNILIGFGFGIIYNLCYFFSFLIVAESFPTFNINILIGLPGESAGSGVFIFVSMLTWGIWEEVLFRGVILTMLLKKYTINKAIIIDSIIFGLYHCFNLLGAADPIIIMIQIISAALGGFLYAFMFVKTESLIPSIICHYLHNVLFSIIENWFSDVLIPQITLVALTTRLFGGLISVIIGIFIIKIGFREKEPYSIVLNSSD